MNELLAINRVAAELGVSSRSLRYWEAAGLFRSARDPQSGWRAYDAHALQCIRLTDLLRRLDIPIRDIKLVLDSGTAGSVREVFLRRLAVLERSQAGVLLQKSVIEGLLAVMMEKENLSLPALETILAPAAASRSRPDGLKMKEMLSVNNLDTIMAAIRIVALPPMRTAAYAIVGLEPEDETSATVLKWVREQRLEGTMRLFGFNTEPYASEKNPAYGFGFCATVPEDAAIAAPLYERRLPGGVYAELDVPATEDPSGTWGRLHELEGSGRWEWAFDSARPGLEEHVGRGDAEGFRISVLVPVVRR